MDNLLYFAHIQVTAVRVRQSVCVCVCVCVFWRCWDEIEDQGFLLGYVEG